MFLYRMFCDFQFLCYFFNGTAAENQGKQLAFAVCQCFPSVGDIVLQGIINIVFGITVLIENGIGPFFHRKNNTFPFFIIASYIIIVETAIRKL